MKNAVENAQIKTIEDIRNGWAKAVKIIMAAYLAYVIVMAIVSIAIQLPNLVDTIGEYFRSVRKYLTDCFRKAAKGIAAFLIHFNHCHVTMADLEGDGFVSRPIDESEVPEDIRRRAE